MGLVGRLAGLPRHGGAARRWLRPPCTESRLPGRAACCRAPGDYEAVFRASVADPEKVWGAAAALLRWDKPWDRALQSRGPGSASW